MNKFNLIRLLLLTSILTISLNVFSKSYDGVENEDSTFALYSSDLLIVPTIATQPQSVVNVCLGEAISLSVVSNGNGVLNYQWQKDGVDMTAETTNVLNIASSVLLDSAVYRCVITDDDGITISANSTVTVNSLPTIGITGNNSICFGESTTLTPSGGVSYVWSPGGQTTPTLSVSPTSDTIYTVIGTDANGCSSSASFSVTVNSLPTIGITGDLVVCEGQTTTLTASGALRYDWGIGFTNVAALDVTPSASTNYIVTGEDSNGCLASASVQVEVSPVPTASVSSNGSVCSGSDTQFIFSGTPDAVVTYKLDSGADTDITLNSSGTFSLPILNALADRTVSIVKVANTNCVNLISTTETLIVEPIPSAPTFISPVTYCQGDITSALSATGTDLKWYLASTSGSPLSQVPVPDSTNPGSFSYYVSQTINGCESLRAEVQVEVNVVPVISISGDDTICTGDSTTLTAAGAVSYVWSPGGQTTPTISVFPTSNTTYTVTGTDASGCSDTTSITINVNPTPTASLSGPSSICSGEDALFTVTGSPNATVVYSINSGANQTVVLDGSGLATITEVNPLVDPEMSLISVNNSDCTASLTDSVTISVNPNAPAPTVTSPLEYCLNDTGLPLTATQNTGNSLVWYNFDGTLLSSAPTADTSSAGTVTYEVSQTNAFGCESARSQITVEVNPTPFAPSVVEPVVNFCLNEVATALNTSGISNPRWYDAVTAGNFLGTSLTPAVNTLGITSYFVSESINGCEGPRSEVQVNVNSVPIAPAVPSASVTYCKNDTATPLTATTSTSGTLKWYLVATGGVGSVTAPVINTTAVGTNTYYVSETNSLGCESLRTAITVTIDDIPATPTVGTVTNPSCSISTGTVTLSNLPSGNWTLTNLFDGTTYSNSTTSYTVNNLDPGTYTFSVSNGICDSAVTNSVTIDAIPVQSAPVVGTLVQPSCTSSTGSVTLTDLPSTGNWTLTRTSDNISITNSGSSYTITGLPSGTYNYTVTNSLGCTSSASLNIIIDAQPTLPNAPIANAQSFLESDSATISDLQISSSGTPVWYNQAVAGSQYTTSFPLVNGNYFAAQVDVSGCESVNRTSVSVTIFPTSVGGSVSGTTTVCSGTNSTVLTLSGQTGSIIRWESSPVVDFTSGVLPISNVGSTYTVVNTTSNLYYRAVLQSGSAPEEFSTPAFVEVTPVSEGGVLSTTTTSICENNVGGVINLASEVGTITQWQESIDNGASWTSISNTTNSYTVSVLTQTTKFRAEVQNGTCPSAFSNEVEIVVNPAPSITDIPNQMFCLGDSATFGEAFIANHTYAWYSNLSVNPSVSIDNSNLKTLNFNQVNTQIFTYRITNSTTGCFVEDTFEIVTDPLPDAQVISDTSICEFESINVGAASVLGNTYSWSSIPVGFTSTNSNPLVTPTVTTTYILTETTPNGCTETNQVIVTMQPEPVISITDGPAFDICETPSTHIQLQSTVINYETSSVVWSNDVGSGDFNDPNILNPTYTPSAADISTGFATLRLTVTGLGPCTQTYSDIITINIDAIPTANAGPDVITCGTVDVPIDASGTLNADAANLVWTLPAGITGTLNAADPFRPVFTPSVADLSFVGSITLSLEAFSGNTCPSDTDSVDILITPPPVVDIAPVEATICDGSNYTFSPGQVTVTNGVPSTYAWTRSGDGTFTNLSSLTPTYIPGASDIINGTVTLTLSTSGNSPCTAPISDDLILNIVKAPLVNAGPDSLACEGPINIIGASIQNAESILWRVDPATGNGFFIDPTVQNPIYVPAASDLNSTVTLIVDVTPMNSCGSNDTDSVLYTINAAPSAVAGGDATICESNNTYQLQSTVANENLITWTSTGSGSFDNVNVEDPIYTLSPGDKSSGSVSFTVTASQAGCAADSDTMVLTIQKNPITNAGLAQTICQGDIVTIPGTGTNASSYSWIRSGGTGSFTNDNTSNPTYTSQANESGTIFLTLEANAIAPCTIPSSSNTTITIVSKPVVDAGNDAQICEDEDYEINSASATNYVDVIWDSDGDGSWTGANTLSPIYSPGDNDKSSGSVILTIRGTKNFPCNADAVDQMKLTINKIPEITFINPNVNLCVDTPNFPITNIVLDHYDTLLWETSGTGNFGGLETTETPTYFPQPADYELGVVTLTLTASRTPLNCNSSTQDTITLNFIEKPTVDAGPPIVSLCEGALAPSFYVTNQATAIDYSTVTWSSSGTGTWSTANPNNLLETYTPSATDYDTGFVILTLEANSNAPCVGLVTDTIQLDLQKLPVITVPPTTSICIDQNTFGIGGVSIAPATAYDINSIVWKTTGTGVFTPSANPLNPIYNPSNADLAAGNVTLTITVDSVAPCAIEVTESFNLLFQVLPVADAGVDLTECDLPFQITTASFDTTTVNNLVWSNGAGDGTFDSDIVNIIDPIYNPGTGDLANGSVTLTLTAVALDPCTADEVTSMVVSFVDSPTVVVVTPQAPICEDETNVAVVGTTITDADSFIWTSTTGTGTTIANPTNLSPIITPSTTDINNGYIDLTLTVTPNAPCGAAVVEVVRIPVQESPILFPGVSQNICEGAIISTIDATETNVTNLVWTNNGGDGTFTASINNITTEYTPGPNEIANGLVELVVTADAIAPCVGTISELITHTITRNPVVTLTTNEDTICESQGSYTIPTGTVSIDNESSVDTFGWTSSGSGTLLVANTLTPSYEPSSADIGTGFVNLIFTLNPTAPCSTQIIETFKLNIDPLATINFTDDGFFCEGVDKPLTATFTNHNASTINWTIISGTGTISAGNTASPTYEPGADSDTVVIQISVDGITPCDEPTTQQFTMNVIKTPVVSMTTLTDTVCSSQSKYNLTGNSVEDPTNNTINWTRVNPVGTGDFSNPTDLNPSYTFNAADIANGFVTLRLTATSNAPCSSTDFEEITITIDQAPNATISSLGAVCAEEPYTATALNLDGNTLAWTEINGNHGTFINANSDTATFNQFPGNEDDFEIQLTSTSTATCAPFVQTLLVVVQPKPTVDVVDSVQEVCSSEPFVISGVTATDYASILWTVDGTGSSAGFSNPTELNPTFTPTNPQILAGQVVLKVTALAKADCGNAFDVSDTITLNFDPELTVSFTAPTSICEDDTIALVGLAPDSSSISWSTSSTTSTSGFADPTNLNTIYTPSALDLSLGRVTLTLTGVSNTNCPDATYDLEVLIEKNPIAEAGGPISICEGTISYQVNDAFAYNYDNSVSTNINWSLTGPATIQAGTQNDLNPIIVPTLGATGDIILTLTVNGFDSCNTTDTDTKTITITPSPLVVVPTSRTICEGETLTLTSSEISASNYASVLWTSSNGLGTFTPNNDLATIYTPAAGQTGTVDLILTASSTNGSCSSDSSPVQLEIIAKPVVNAGVDATICVTETYTVVGASVLNEFTYTWSVTGPAQILSGESTTTPVIASDAGATGTAVVTLTAVGTGACPVSITDSFNLEINPSPVVDAGVDAILCEGTASYQLVGSVVDAVASTTYFWTTSNGSGTLQTTADPLQPIYIPGPTDFNSATGFKDIQFDLTATSTNGCVSSTDSMVLTIYANPIVSAGTDIFDVCEDTDVILSSATASNYSSITWSTSGNGTFDYSSSLINPIYSLGLDDTTSVTLTLSAMPNAACSQVPVLDTMTIYINQDTTLTASTNEISMCGATFTLPDLIDVSNATSILWTNITGASGTPGVLTNVNSETPSFTPSADEIANGFVLLRVETIPEAGCTTVLTETITVNLQPKLEVEAGASLLFCDGEDIIVSGNGASTSNASTFTWSHDGTGSIEASTVNTLTPKYNPGISETGVITLTLTATSIAPCTGAVFDTMTVTIQSQPTVTVGADFTVCESSNINIVNTTETNANTIIWTSSQNSDGSSSGAYVSGIFTNDAILNPSYTPSQDDIDLGYVYLTIRVSNIACGTFVTDVLKVTIADGVGVFAGVNATVCESDTSYALLDATSNATSVTWISSENSNGTSSGTYLPGSFTDPTAVNPEYNPSIDDINRGYVYLTITGSGNSSCPVNSSFMLLNIIKDPTVSAIDISTCVSTTTGITLNGSGTNYDTLTWSIIDGPGSVINDVYFSGLGTDIPSNVVTRLRLVATPLGVCADNAIQEITVTTQALPSVEAGDNGAICYIPGTAIAPFTILGTDVTNASSVSWTTSGSLSGNFNLGNPVVYESFSNSCTPEVLTLTADGVGACSTESVSDSVTLTINCTIPNLGAISGLNTICQGNLGVVYTVPVNSNVITYDWQVPTGATIVSGQGTNSISVDYGPTAVSGNVSVNGVNGCGSGPSSTLPITISELPTTSIVSGTQTVCEGSTHVYTTTVIPNTNSYLWTLPDGSTISTLTNTISIAFAASATSGNLSVQGNNSCGLGASSAALPITVQSQPTLTSTLTPPSICSDETFEYVPTSALASTTYSWTRAVISGISNTAGSGTGIISEVLTNTSSVTIPVNYIITLTSEDGCSDSETITVDVDPNPILTSATPVAAICSGDQFNHTLTSNVTGSINWTRASVTGITEPGSSGVDTISEVLTNVTTAPITVVYSALLPANLAGCTGDPITFDVVVNPEPNVDQPIAQNLCVGEILNVDFDTTNTGGISGYTWANNNPSIGLPSTGSGDISGITMTNTSSVSQIANIVVTPTFDNEGISCTGPTKTFTITINPAAQVNSISSEVVCNGDSTTSIIFTTSNSSGATSYSWTNDNTSIGLVASGSTDIGSFVATNSSTIPQVATIVVTPTYTFNGKDCAGSPETFTITVNPSAQINQPTSLLLCEGEIVPTINFTTLNTVGTTTYNWTNDNVNIGIATANGTGDISSFTALNSTGTPQVATITVTPTFDHGGLSCTGPSKTFTITVNPSAQVDPIGSSTVCAGDLISAINFSTLTTLGTTTYSWTNSNTTIGSILAAGTGNIAPFTAINTSTIPQVANITVTPTFTYNGQVCSGNPETFSITVNPTAEVDQPSNEVFCESDVAVINFNTSNTVGTTTYEWTNSNTAIGLTAVSGVGSSITFSTTNTGTTPITSTIQVTPTFSFNGVDCEGPNKVFTITVNPNANMIAPTSQTLCEGDSTVVTFNTLNSVGTTTYAWTNNTPSIGIPTSGTSDISTFTAINTSNSPIVASLSVTPTYTHNGQSCTGAVENFTITVNPSAQVNQPVSLVFCDGDSVGSTSFSSSNTMGTTTYSWTNDNLSTGLNISSGTGDVPTFTATNSGTAPVVSTITVTPFYDNGGVICTGPSETYTITVNPVAQVNAQAPQTVCNGDSTSLTFTTVNTVGLTTYTWSNSNTSIGLPASGTGSIPTFIASNLTGTPVVANITVTPNFTNDGLSCSGPSETITITVNPSGQVVQPVSEVVCNGDTTSVVNFTTNNTIGTTTFSWTNSNPSIGLGASGTGPIPSFVASNTTNATAIGTITVTPSYEFGGESCEGVSKTFTITVNPESELIQPLAQVICDGDAFFYNFNSNNTGGTTTYAWTNNNIAIGLGASGVGNIPSFTATNSGLIPSVATIQVTPTFSNGGVSCVGSILTFSITVNPSADVVLPTSVTVCNTDSTPSVNFVSANNSGATTYEWNNNNPSIGLAASGIGNIPSFIAVNNGNIPVVASIVVTPVYNYAGVSCSGLPKTFTITVNPTAELNVPISQVLCNGENTNLVSFSSNNLGGTTTYTWENNNSTIGLVANGTDNIGSFTAVNTGFSPIVATITVTPTYTNDSVSCVGATETFTITVNPSAHVIQPIDQTICTAGLTTEINFNTLNTLGTTTYTWTNNNTSTGLGASGSGTILPFTALNTGLSPNVSTITVTPIFTYDGEACNGTSKEFLITVNPVLDINPPADQSLCDGMTTAAVNFSSNNTGGTVNYSWINNNTSIGLAPSGSGNILPFIAVNSGATLQTATITVTASYSNAGQTCDSTETFLISVSPSPVATISGLNNYLVCENDTPPFITFEGSNGTAPYTFTYQINSDPVQQVVSSGTSNTATISVSTINSGTNVITLLSVSDSSIPTACTSTNITLPNEAFVDVQEQGTIIPQDSSTVSQVVCQDTAIAPIVFDIGGSATSAFVTGLPSGLTPSFDSALNLLTISGSPTSSGTFNYVVNTAGSTNGCNSTYGGTIIVNSNDVITELTPTTIDQELCECDTLAPISYNLGGGATGGDVQFTPRMPVGITWSIASNILTISGASCEIGTFNYTVNSFGICSADTYGGTIEIKENSIISLVSGNPDPIVCEGSAFASPIQYAISPTTATLVMTPTIPGVTFNPTTGIISGAPTQSGVYNYSISSGTGCSNTMTGVITVNPDQDISFISTNNTQITCQNSPIDPVVFLVSPGVDDVTISPALPQGVNYAVNSGIITISGTPTNFMSVAQNFIVTTIGSCGISKSESFTLEVRQEATITVTSDVSTINQAICQSGSIEPITFTIGGGATGIETVNLPDNLVLDYDAGTGVYTVSGTPVGFGTFNFNIVTTGCVATQLFSVTNINTNVSIELTSAVGTDDQLLCQSNFSAPITPIVYTLTGATGVTVTGLPIGINPVFDVTTGQLVISGTPIESGEFNYAITTLPCARIKTGVIKVSTPIAFFDEQVTQVSCTGENDGSISIDIRGGASVGGLYAIKWSGPNGFQQNQATITGLEPGVYTISGTDSLGCAIPTKSYVIADVQPVEISLLSTSNVTCNGSLGCADFDFTGGTGIYTSFLLEYLDPSSETLTPITVANNNYFNICDLRAGLYYLTIEDSNSCTSVPYLFTIFDYSSLTIESVELDDSLCADAPGNVRIKVASLDPSLAFYYNNVLVPHLYLGDSMYELAINNPTAPSGIIKVKNDQDCWNTISVSTPIESPGFEYTSLNFVTYNAIDVNESIEFTNTVDLNNIPAEYDYIVWDFGDNSPFKVFFNPEDTVPNSDGDSFKTVFHSYTIDGVYTVTLTVFNSLGCSRVETQIISVGRGANIMTPTAFSPNNDGINDLFRASLIGFTEVSMFVYDNWGNIVYEITSEVNALDPDWGWNGLEKGNEEPINGNYKYFVIATTIEGEVVEKTGQLMLIK